MKCKLLLIALFSLLNVSLQLNRKTENTSQSESTEKNNSNIKTDMTNMNANNIKESSNNKVEKLPKRGKVNLMK